ncbi:MAG: hypothetical protein ACYTGH_13880, partial [Planctomycetota bacterium]
MTARFILRFAFTLSLLAGSQNLYSQEPPYHPLQLEEVLPPSTLLLLRSPDLSQNSPLQKTAIVKLLNHPEGAEFIDELNNHWEGMVDSLISNSKADRETVTSLLSSQINLAFIGFDILSGKEKACLAINLTPGTDPETVFTALKELARSKLSNKIPAQELHHQGTRILNLAMPGTEHPIFKEENYFTILRDLLILSPNRSVVEGAIGRYQSRGVGTPLLSQEQPFRAVKTACQEQSGGGFAYVNNGLLLPVLSLFIDRPAQDLIATLGLRSVSHIGLSLACRREGIENSLYLHAPGPRQGLLRALSSQGNCEDFSGQISANHQSLFSARVDLLTLYRVLPPVVNAFSRLVSGQAGLGGQTFSLLTGKEEIFGIPASEVLAPLGDALIVSQTRCGTVLRFPKANIKAFKAVVARMEKNLGGSFTAISEGEHVLRYFNQFKTP